MYITSMLVGAPMAWLAIYCGIPWPMRIASYLLMGIVIGVAWHLKPPDKKENNENKKV